MQRSNTQSVLHSVEAVRACRGAQLLAAIGNRLVLLACKPREGRLVALHYLATREATDALAAPPRCAVIAAAGAEQQSVTLFRVARQVPRPSGAVLGASL